MGWGGGGGQGPGGFALGLLFASIFKKKFCFLFCQRCPSPARPGWGRGVVTKTKRFWFVSYGAVGRGCRRGLRVGQGGTKGGSGLVCGDLGPSPPPWAPLATTAPPLLLLLAVGKAPVPWPGPPPAHALTPLPGANVKLLPSPSPLLSFAQRGRASSACPRPHRHCALARAVCSCLGAPLAPTLGCPGPPRGSLRSCRGVSSSGSSTQSRAGSTQRGPRPPLYRVRFVHGLLALIFFL